MTGAHKRGFPRSKRRSAHLRLAWNADGQAGALVPTGLSDWDKKFLRQLAEWPVALAEPQRVMLRDIARRAR
jgi:hypothetical protein